MAPDLWKGKSLTTEDTESTEESHGEFWRIRWLTWAAALWGGFVIGRWQ